ASTAPIRTLRPGQRRAPRLGRVEASDRPPAGLGLAGRPGRRGLPRRFGWPTSPTRPASVTWRPRAAWTREEASPNGPFGSPLPCRLALGLAAFRPGGRWRVAY